MKEPALSIGLGTAAIGRPRYINIRQEAVSEISLEEFRKNGVQVLEAAYMHGVRYFDTAPGYGLAEQLLMDWVMEKDDANIEVATKWGYTYVAGFDPKATQHEIKEHSLSKLNEQWKQSQDLLPLLTTYQIHSATFDTGVLENKEILNRLAELKIEHGLLVGISTTGANQVDIIKRALDVQVEGKELFDVFQVTYNLLDQSLAQVAPQLLAENKRVVIKEALANGRIFPNKEYPGYLNVYKKLNELANKYNTGIDAIALRFCADSLDAYKVLSGAATTGHLSENLKATQFVLEENEIATMKKLAIAPQQYWQERKQLEWS